MAFSNTYDTTNTGSAVSNREDLTDVLSILAPEETPILSSLNKQKANATFVEWTVDSLADYWNIICETFPVRDFIRDQYIWISKPQMPS